MISIIAYKQDSSDSCRGCLMNSWGSDFKFAQTTSQEEAAKIIADIFRTPLEDREGGYEITLTIGDAGMTIYNKKFEKSYCDCIVETEADDIALEQTYQLAIIEFKRLAECDEEAKRQAAIVAAQKKEAAAILAAQQQRESELQLLATLQAKYN